MTNKINHKAILWLTAATCVGPALAQSSPFDPATEQQKIHARRTVIAQQLREDEEALNRAFEAVVLAQSDANTAKTLLTLEKNKLAAAEKALTEEKTKSGASSQAVKKLEEDVKQERANVEQLTRDLKTSQDELSRLSEEHKKQETKHRKWKERFRAAEVELVPFKVLGRSASTLGRDVTQRDELLGEKDRWDKTEAQLREEIAQAKQELADARTRHDANSKQQEAEAAARLKAAQDQLANMQKAQDELAQQHAPYKALGRSASELGRYVNLKKTPSTLARDVAERDTLLGEKDQWGKTEAQLREDITKTQQELADARTRHDASSKQQEAEAAAKLQKLQAELEGKHKEALEAQNKAAQAKLEAREKDLLAQLQAKAEEIARVEKAKGDSSRQAAELQEQLTALKTAHTQLKKAHEEETARFTKERGELDHTLQEARSEVERFKSLYQTTDAQRSMQAGEVERLRTQLAELKKPTSSGRTKELAPPQEEREVRFE